MSKRLILTIDEGTGRYSVDMPDGAIDTNELLSSVDDLMGELLKAVLETQQEEDLDESLFSISTPKQLN